MNFDDLKGLLSRSKSRNATTMACALCGAKPQINASIDWRFEARPDQYPDYPGELRPILFCPSCDQRRIDSPDRCLGYVWTRPTTFDGKTRRSVYRATKKQNEPNKLVPKDPQDLKKKILDVLKLNDEPMLTKTLADAVEARMTDIVKAIRLLEPSGEIYRSRDVKGRTVWEVAVCSVFLIG
jgi:hypothetical protein